MYKRNSTIQCMEEYLLFSPSVFFVLFVMAHDDNYDTTEKQREQTIHKSKRKDIQHSRHYFISKQLDIIKPTRKIYSTETQKALQIYEWKQLHGQKLAPGQSITEASDPATNGRHQSS